MTHAAAITIKFVDWWMSGTGRAGSGDVDAVPHRDRFGCPAMPMTQVKGQLRESAERLARPQVAGWSDDLVVALFGKEENNAGALAFRGDAALDETTARWLAKKRTARAQLSRRIFATKIDKYGAAEDDTLRSVEAAVPLTLSGKVYWIGPGNPIVNWVVLLDAACAATLSFGKLKTDGYGRAVASCKPINEAGP